MIGSLFMIFVIVCAIISFIVVCIFCNLCYRYNINYSDCKRLTKLQRNGSRFGFIRYYYLLAKNHRILFLLIYYSFLFKRWLYAHIPVAFGIGLLLLILVLWFVMVLK